MKIDIPWVVNKLDLSNTTVIFVGHCHGSLAVPHPMLQKLRDRRASMERKETFK
jgi:hypothetical protein